MTPPLQVHTKVPVSPLTSLRSHLGVSTAHGSHDHTDSRGFVMQDQYELQGKAAILLLGDAGASCQAASICRGLGRDSGSFSKRQAIQACRSCRWVSIREWQGTYSIWPNFLVRLACRRLAFAALLRRVAGMRGPHSCHCDCCGAMCICLQGQEAAVLDTAGTISLRVQGSENQP